MCVTTPRRISFRKSHPSWVTGASCFRNAGPREAVDGETKADQEADPGMLWNQYHETRCSLHFPEPLDYVPSHLSAAFFSWVGGEGPMDVGTEEQLGV